MSQAEIAASKLMSLVLRHKPEELGLTLDANGWVAVADLVAASDGQLTFDLVARVVETSEKKRFALSADGTRIRANQGHSVNVDLGLEPVTPPERLFHGTATRFAASIRQEGLQPRSRQYVHLSPNPETARTVGTRHGKPVVLTVQAQAAHASGRKFFLSANGVWLAEAVPPEFLVFPGSA